jgi:predicted dehydrogenase
MAHKSNRRRFIQSTAAAGVGFWAAGGIPARASRLANDRISFGCIGVGGKGSSDSDDAGRHGDVIAICDVDDNTLNGRGRKFPKAEKFTDFRTMLDQVGKRIDAVTVSTADHCHAPASIMAMRMGKHCFTQKPLTHTIEEARLMGQIAREKKLATEMGNQGTATSGLREAAALLKAGILGKVTEVHVWTNRPIWPQGGARPKPKEGGPPKHVNWDAWLGPAPERPFADGYHPFAWRGWWDFGTGALGDMACHTVNMPFAGLGLRDPSSVQATSSGHNGDSYPKWSIIEFIFPANGKRDEIKFTWYDGGKRPPSDLLEGRELKGSGCAIVGDKGKMYSPDDYGSEYYLIGSGIEKPKVEITKSPGHFEEWVRAIKGGDPAMSNFADYAGPLTETILLGNLAVYAAKEADQPGKKVMWDAKKLVATNAPELMPIVKKEYRKGWDIHPTA